MSKTLVKQNLGGVQVSSTTLLIGLALLALLVWYLLKNRTAMAATYTNEEKWDVDWDTVTMLPKSITVHRNAVRG